MGPDAPNMDIDEEAVIDFNMVVTEIPQFYPETPAMISQGPSICIFNKKDTNTVLASWLFAQYLLTNEVQIAYAQTEGYVPVTSTAQGSPEYQDYLSRSGEDNNLYYDIKIEATKLLLENIDNTFITPVFNGSASLRNAAGLLIEQTGKSVKRGIAITDEQINAIYKQSSSLYKLDEISDNQIKDGKLPTGAIVLISTLACAWITIMSYLIFMYVKARKKEQK